METKTLDLGCGLKPKNPFNCDVIYGVDIREDLEKRIFKLDLAVDNLPFEDNFFDFCSAYDFIEHIPRIIYLPERKFPFVNLMSEIFRTLKPGGKFLSFTPAYPSYEAFRDPTHVNIITDETFVYFDNKSCYAKAYGFKGGFEIEKQYWSKRHWWKKKVHLVSILRKPINSS